MIRVKPLLLALCLLATPLAGAAQSTDALNLVNRAAEQRMLSQRVAKSFAQIGLNVQPMAAMQEFDAAVARFEDNLKVLEQGATGDTARASLDRLRQAWAPLRQATRGQPRRESAILVAHQADEVLAAAEVLVRNVQNTGTGNAGRLVAQAGLQRMLSQRIAKSYLLISWGDTSDVTREELDRAVNEFSGTLAALRQSSENTPDIQRELDEMAQHWEWMQTALAAEGASSYRLIVTEAAEAILGSADRTTRLYEKLAR
jgi:hypothetical protein